ncbi:Ger(x)C family spore germination protein [Paenibacillus sp. MBLB4367]|uniref:Ger(x)C family spore germination protein n=1 Tax=Paenibacillus sp. MBLB4367 TaxID=3384767 RepID=UPI0039082A59
MKLFRQFAVFLLTVTCLLLSGCGNAKDADMLDYINGIGIDYADNEYIVYFQMLSVSNIAKSEGSNPTENTPLWIGKGRGKTITEAVAKIYESSPKEIFWGHTTGLLLTENLLRSPEMKTYIREFDRFHETRYTSWVFATSDPIEKVFTVKPSFEQTRLLTRLHNPEDGYKQYSMIRPLMLHDFVADYYDDGRSTLLPSLKVTGDTWEKDNAKKSSFTLGGVHVFQKNKYKGFIPAEKFVGARWLENETEQSFLTVEHGGKIAAMLKLIKPKSDIRIIREDGRIRYGVTVSATAILSNKMTDISMNDLQKAAEKKVAEQIRLTFQEGLNLDADVLQLNQKLHRFHYKLWKAVHPGGGGSAALTADSLGPVDVHVSITLTGKYKYSR